MYDKSRELEIHLRSTMLDAAMTNMLQSLDIIQENEFVTVDALEQDEDGEYDSSLTVYKYIAQ